MIADERSKLIGRSIAGMIAGFVGCCILSSYGWTTWQVVGVLFVAGINDASRCICKLVLE